MASVVTNTPYGASDLVEIENLKVFTQSGGNTPVPSMADVGLHKAIFVGDTNADGLYTAQDAGWTSSIVVGSFTGFDTYSWTDPVIVADVNQNGGLDGLDSSWISRKGLSPTLQPEIPNLPAGGLPIPAGIDPTIAADNNVAGAPGGTVNLPLRITDNATGLFGVDVFLNYNTLLLDLPDGLNAGSILLAGMFASEGGWTIDTLVDDAAGTARISIYRSSPSTSVAGQIANVAFGVRPSAPAGTTPIQVSGHANVPPFSFTFVNGSIVIGNGTGGPTDLLIQQQEVRENTSLQSADYYSGSYRRSIQLLRTHSPTTW